MNFLGFFKSQNRIQTIHILSFSEHKQLAESYTVSKLTFALINHFVGFYDMFRLNFDLSLKEMALKTTAFQCSIKFVQCSPAKV